jgi:hypothetical protein
MKALRAAVGESTKPPCTQGRGFRLSFLVKLEFFEHLSDTFTLNFPVIAKQAKVGMIWVAGRSPTLVSHSEAWRSHES